MKQFDKNLDSPEISAMVPDPITGELVRQYTKILFGEAALEFIRPGDEGYAEKVAVKKDSKILYVDYKDLYAEDNTVILDYL